MSLWRIRHAAHILRQGGVIAYPTEAVYGLGCLPDNPKSIQRLLQLKQRPMEKGLILLAADFSQVEHYVSPLESSLLQKINTSWPGPITWLLPTPADTPELLRGQYHSIAIRISAHPVVRALCEHVQSPIISTSANLSGKSMTYSAFEVRLQFQDQLDFILNAPLGDSDKPSVIKDVLTDRIIRQG